MAVFAHAEDNEVEDRLAFVVERGDAAEFGFGFPGRVLIFDFAVDAMDLLGANMQRIEERLPRSQEV